VVGQSTKNLAVVREAYQLGQLRLLDVLNEQRRLTDTELLYLDARVAAARALADLERVSGGLLP
jgi:cobalt-zinc-cadmium efflux system outer membrane protein